MVSAMGALLRRGRALSYSYCHTQAIWASSRLAHTTARASREGRVGPDRVLPANSFTSTYPDGRVEIRYSDRDPRCAEKPISVWTMLNNTADRVPDNIALAVKRNDVWVNWTYNEYREEVKAVAKAFIKLGLKPFHSVGILGFNAPEWHISAVAAVCAGGLTAGIYTTNSVDATRYVAEHSRANIMVVEDEEQREKIDTVWDRLPELQAVVQYTGNPTAPGVKSWKALLDLGKAQPDSILTERLEAQAVNQACTLVYTSGTTGNPKGVMLSQDNLTWTAQRAHEVYDWKYDEEQVVSYLPLSHVAGTFIDIYLSMWGGGTVHFADKMALQGTLLKTLVEAKPTLFFGVPRVYEKIQEKMMEVGKANTGVKKKVGDWAKASSFEHHQALMEGKPGNSLQYRIAKKVVLSKVHQALGFERAKGWYSSAAPLSDDVFQYFQSLDMPIQELLGSSETSGPQTASTPGTGTKLGSVGRPYDTWEVEVQDPDPDRGLGEIVTRGRNCCMGYLWDEAKTAELIDPEGWVHSGDLGRFDEDGFLYIGGRQKEIIVTGGGENVAPVPIEEMIKVQMKDIVSNCMVLGDKRKHLACILTLRTVLDAANLPTDELHPDVLAWAEELGAEATTVTELLEEDNEEVKLEIMAQIQKVNRKAISNAQKVHKFMIAPKDFSLPGGELTPTMKLKRHTVMEMYEKKIQQMYEHETQSSMW